MSTEVVIAESIERATAVGPVVPAAGARSWRHLTLAAIDVETTGLDPERDRIIEIGIIEMVDGEVSDRYCQLINPGMPIPRAVRDLTGIQEEDVVGAPSFETVAREVQGRLSGRCVVGYNLSFDRSFVTAELQRAGLSWPEGPTLDPLIFARALLPWLKTKKLVEVAAALGVELHEAHRAGDDAEAAGRVLYAFGHRLPDDLISSRPCRRSGAIPRGIVCDSHGARSGEVEGGPLVISLGPAYIYGDEVDPYRALFRALPDARMKSA
jgi:DNA polymerase-3 subunit epsilon